MFATHNGRVDSGLTSARLEWYGWYWYGWYERGIAHEQGRKDAGTTDEDLDSADRAEIWPVPRGPEQVSDVKEHGQMRERPELLVERQITKRRIDTG